MHLSPRLRPMSALAALRQAAWAAPTAMVLAGGLALGTVPARAADAEPPAAAASAPTVRAEVAKPLMAAQEALKVQDHAQALVHVGEAEQVPSLTDYESYVIRRLKSAALYGTGDQASALPLFEGLIEDPLLPPADKRLMTESTIKIALQLKDYPRALRWMKPHVASGDASPELLRLYPQVLYATGDHAAAAEGLSQLVADEEAAGRKPTESMLRMLASSRGKINDDAGYVVALRKLATTTGKPAYWKELVQRVALSDGFDREALRLDLYRLRQAMGDALSADELSDMAFRAERAGLPGESQVVLDEGFGNGRLGSHQNAAADRQLLDKVRKAAAGDRAAAGDAAAMRKDTDGKAMLGLGFALAGGGDTDRGLPLMRDALAKGGLDNPALARLHYGVAQYWAGQNDAARATFAGVEAGGGVGELARLWADWIAAGAPRMGG